MTEENRSLKRQILQLESTAEQLELTSDMLSCLLNTLDAIVYVSDFFTGELLEANQKFKQFYHGGAPIEAGTKCWSLVGREKDGLCPFCPHEKLLQKDGGLGPPIVWEQYFQHLGRWLRITSQAIYWVDGRLAHMITQVDVTQEKELQQTLEHLAYIDQSMNIPNELAFFRDINNIALVEEQRSFVICFDIVSLRKINDVYGRLAGDRLLSCVLHWVEQQWPIHRVYRIEGDCLCLMLWDVSLDEAHRIAKQIQSRFELRWELDVGTQSPLSVFCNVTLGIIDARELQDSKEPVMMIERTLDAAKSVGGLAIFNSDLEQELRYISQMELSLKQSVSGGMQGFAVYYQPIVVAATGRWCGLEALCRWDSPEFGAISPEEFIPKAEQMGLINPIGRWVIETAVSQCKKWNLDQLSDFMLNVNISAQQLADERLLESLKQTLEKNDYPGRKLTLEVTESMEFDIDSSCEKVISDIRALSVNIALDDFGTGYASFERLINLPVSLLKTERTFIENIENDDYLQYLFQILIEMANATGANLVTEGVETQEQMQLLINNGATLMQGFLFSKPLSASDMEPQLGRFTSRQETQTFNKEHVKQLLDPKLGHTLSPQVYRVLNQSIKLLLEDDTDHALREINALIGSKLGYDRTGIFLKTEDDAFTLAYNWVNNDTLETLEYDLGTFGKSLFGIIEEHELFATSDLGVLPVSMKEYLENMHIQSFGVMPVKNGNEVLGAFCVGSYQAGREWSAPELLLLNNISMILAGVLTREGFMPAQINDPLEPEQFMRALRQLLRRNEAANLPLTVCWLKVDLHDIAEDQAVRLTGRLLNETRNFVRKGDILCRWSKSELVIVLDACQADRAMEKIAALRHSMLQIGTESEMVPSSFFFGLAESGEEEVAGAGDKAERLMSLAQRRGSAV